jgi:hypothetical protein
MLFFLLAVVVVFFSLSLSSLFRSLFLFFLNERRESVNSLMAFFHYWMMVNRRNDEERWWVVLWAVIDGTPLPHLPERWVGLTHFFLCVYIYCVIFSFFDLILMNRKKNWFSWRHWKDNDSNASNIIQGYRDKSACKDRQKVYSMIIYALKRYRDNFISKIRRIHFRICL